MRHKCPVLWSVLLLLVLSSGASGSDITVTTVPDGALVAIRGEATVTGVSPVRFTQPLMGDYTIEATMPGYERRSQRVVLAPDKPMKFALKLNAKTRLKAAMRSLLIPGWGQRYGERPQKGIAFLSLSVASVLVYMIADRRFDNEYQDYLDVRQRYDDAMSTADRLEIWPGLQRAQRSAFDAEDDRQIAGGVVAGIWAANVLDALFFAPHRSAGISVKAGYMGSSMTPDPGLRFVVNF